MSYKDQFSVMRRNPKTGGLEEKSIWRCILDGVRDLPDLPATRAVLLLVIDWAREGGMSKERAADIYAEISSRLLQAPENVEAARTLDIVRAVQRTVV